MKISKIFAGMSALAIAGTAVIPAFAEKEITDTTGLDYVEVKEADGVYQYYIDLAASPYDPATVSSIKYTFTIDDTEGFGGGLMLNSKKSGWDQDGTTPGDWGSEGSEKSLTPEGSDGNYTLTFDFGALGEDYWGSPSDEEYWAQVVCQLWWGADLTMTGIEIVGEEKQAAPEDSSEAANEESSSEAANDESSKAEESSSKADESSKAESSKAESSKASTTTATKTNNATTTAASSAAAATDSTATDNTNQATGATAGLALAGLALAGAVAVVSKRK
ncbi:NPXTG-anchored protein [Ruminococcus sp.]|uniref:NPXTG-anchored protein n=1 Tax=Ruminococcus sp. TaxID=41978 RepID=UPI0025FC7330|nr:NPXTG-anchored protein [Ruminococcus sp.]MBQ8966322.1 NPXTG-anchored protein [Ruminococcus sp.]